MQNSLVHSLEGYLNAIFSDLRFWYGSARDWERDRNRSLHELAVRGERMLTIDWPAIRKHLDQCLEEGLYSFQKHYLTGRASRKAAVPAFCKDLYLQVFDVDGKLREDPNPEAVAALRQLYDGWGKLKHPCKERYITDEVKNFLDNEKDLRYPTLAWYNDDLHAGHTWKGEDWTGRIVEHKEENQHFNDDRDHIRFHSYHDDDDPLFGPDNSTRIITNRDAHVLQRVCDIVSASFGDLHKERESERPKHGTGAVSNQKRNRSKYDFTYWPNKLNRVFPYDWYGTHDLGYHAHFDSVDNVRNHEHPSKLIAVPKTMTGPRLIGSEPNYHQWIQQLVRSQLEGRIKRTPLRNCVSFGDQTPNQTLARIGSVTGEYATIDLKSASDRLSCWTVERALRGNLSLLERIHACRTRTMRNAIDKQFDSILLKKCFTQGSACTFPVQTIVYSMVAIAAVILSEMEDSCSDQPRQGDVWRASSRVRVFGDDMIVPTEALPKAVELLEFLQLKVNYSKTFFKGRFRESCGLDAFMGVNVTPVRVKRFSTDPSHEVAQSMLESSNNYHRRGYWHTAAWLQDHLASLRLPIVRLHDSDGLSSFCGSSLKHLKHRWNEDLQRYEVKIHQLTSKSKKVPTESAYDMTEFLFGRMDGKENSTLFPDPKEGGLGIVDKVASVMKQGWVDANRFLDN